MKLTVLGNAGAISKDVTENFDFSTAINENNVLMIVIDEVAYPIQNLDDKQMVFSTTILWKVMNALQNDGGKKLIDINKIAEKLLKRAA